MTLFRVTIWYGSQSHGVTYDESASNAAVAIKRAVEKWRRNRAPHGWRRITILVDR